MSYVDGLINQMNHSAVHNLLKKNIARSLNFQDLSHDSKYTIRLNFFSQIYINYRVEISESLSLKKMASILVVRRWVGGNFIKSSMAPQLLARATFAEEKSKPKVGVKKGGKATSGGKKKSQSTDEDTENLDWMDSYIEIADNIKRYLINTYIAKIHYVFKLSMEIFAMLN